MPGIGDHAHALERRRAQLGLRLHVVGLALGHAGEGREGFEQLVGSIDVGMHANAVTATGNHQRIQRQRRQRVAHPHEVEFTAGEHAFGAKAKVAGGLNRLQMHLIVLAAGGIPGFRRHPQGATAAIDEVLNAFQEIDKSGGASVDHAGGAQYRQLVGRIRQRLASAHKSLPEEYREVADAGLDLTAQFTGVIGDDAEHGAFARIGQTRACSAGGTGCGSGQFARASLAAAAQALRKPLKKLRQDRAGVAARTIDGLARHAPEHGPDIRATQPAYGLQYRQHGEREVGPGIAIGHRKHVDAVQVVAFGQHAAGAGDERALEARAAEALEGVGNWPVGHCMHDRRSISSRVAAVVLQCSVSACGHIGVRERTPRCPTRSRTSFHSARIGANWWNAGFTFSVIRVASALARFVRIPARARRSKR